VLAAEQALADGAQLIIGPLFANSASAVANAVAPFGVNTVAFTTDRNVLRRGLYSIGYLPESEVDRIISFSARQGLSKIAALVPQNAYGNLLSNSLQNATTRHGVQLTRVQRFTPSFDAMDDTATEFSEYYTNNPELDGVILAASGKSLQALSSFLAFRDVLPSEVKYLGLGSWDDEDTFGDANLRDGWFPGLEPLLKAEFEAAFTQSYSSEPAPIAALGYDAVVVASSLISDPAGGFPFSSQNIERPEGFSGMSGRFRLLSDGRNERLLTILGVGRRTFDVVEPAAPAFPDALTQLGGLSQ